MKSGGRRRRRRRLSGTLDLKQLNGASGPAVDVGLGPRDKIEIVMTALFSALLTCVAWMC